MHEAGNNSSEASGPAAPFVLQRGEHPISRKDIDPDVFRIIYRLHQQGFIAYLVGGAVRDLLLGKTPKDFDVATDARPGQIKKRFRNAFLIGRRFRLAHIHFPGGKIIEVATFRRDPEELGAECPAPEPPPSPEEAAAPRTPGPSPAPPPDHLNIYGTPSEDAFRRDTTINGLFFDVITSSVIDFVGGLEDLARRKVRIIGDPAERFREDPVRVWRVIRQAARLRFEIEEGTARAIPAHRQLVSVCAGSRLFEELNKELMSETMPVLEALHRHGLLPFILGKVGEDYDSQPETLDRLLSIFQAKDRLAAAGAEFSPEELYTLLFWPWVETRLGAAEGDLQTFLKNAYASLRTQATIPKALMAGVVQVQVILAALQRALRTGNMRWSLRGRPHYPQASRLFFLITKMRLPAPHESFASLFAEAFPEKPPRRRRRRKPRRRPPASPSQGNPPPAKTI